LRELIEWIGSTRVSKSQGDQLASWIGAPPNEIPDDELIERTEKYLAARESDVPVFLNALTKRLTQLDGKQITVRVPRATGGRIKLGDVFSSIIKALTSRDDIRPYLFDRHGRLRDLHLFIGGRDMTTAPDWKERWVPEDSEFSLRPEGDGF